MEFLFETVDRFGKVIGCLGIFRKACFFCLFQSCLEVCRLDLFQTLVSGQDIHGQFLEVDQVLLIELIQQGDVLHQCDLMVLQDLDDLVDIGVGTVVFGLESVDLVGILLEQFLEESVFFIDVEVAQFRDQFQQGITDGVDVLGLDVL